MAGCNNYGTIQFGNEPRNNARGTVNKPISRKSIKASDVLDEPIITERSVYDYAGHDKRTLQPRSFSLKTQPCGRDSFKIFDDDSTNRM